MPKVPMTDADRFRAGRDTVLAGLPFETAAGLDRLRAQDVRVAREATAADAWLAATAQSIPNWPVRTPVFSSR